MAVRSPGLSSLVPQRVEMDQLLCLPEPLTPAKGFSWRSAARPCLRGDLLADLHHHEVLVRLDDDGAEEGRELVLVGRHLPVARLERDAELVALLLDLLHAAAPPPRVDGRHVVVAELLAARGHLAHDGAAGELEVHAALVGLAGDEEELLLEADVVHGALDLEAAGA